MAAPNQPNPVPLNQPEPKIGPVFDFIISLSKMIITVKDIDPDNRTCLICTEPYADNSPSGKNTPVKLSCGHVFDLGCLLKWLSIQAGGSQRNVCPLCFKPLFHHSRSEQKFDVRHLQKIDEQRIKEKNDTKKGCAVVIALFFLMNYAPRAAMWPMGVFAGLSVIQLFLQYLGWR